MNISVGVSHCHIDCKFYFCALHLLSVWGVSFPTQRVTRGPCADDVLYKCHVHIFVFRERGFFPSEHAEMLSAWLVFLHNMTIIRVVPVMAVNPFPVQLYFGNFSSSEEQCREQYYSSHLFQRQNWHLHGHLSGWNGWFCSFAAQDVIKLYWS